MELKTESMFVLLSPANQDVYKQKIIEINQIIKHKILQMDSETLKKCTLDQLIEYKRILLNTYVPYDSIPFF